MATTEIVDKIKGLEVGDLKSKIRRVINWTCENSLEDNRHTLFANSRLGRIHYKTVLSAEPDVQVFDSALRSLYSGKITEKSVFEIYRISIESKLSESDLKTKEVGALTEKVKQYGSEYMIKSYEFDDVCERETEFVVQTEKIVINEHDALQPEPESNVIEVFRGSASTFSFIFDQRLQFSKNFINCTTRPSSMMPKIPFLFGNPNAFTASNNVLPFKINNDN